MWVELPHEETLPIEVPQGCRPAGIYKVSNNYVGNTQWTDSHGTIHYGTETSSDPNPWWAVNLGSVSKGRTSRFDAIAFNGRGRGADGQLLAGRFYRNYLPNGECFDPVSVVFFQDDTVVSGDLDQIEPPEPTVTPDPGTETDPSPPDPELTPTVEPVIGEGTDPTPTPSPRPTIAPDPRPTESPERPVGPLPALDPNGDFSFAVVVEGSETVIGSGRARVEVLRGGPVEIYLLPLLEPPVGDPAAVVTFRSWRFESGPNDHPRGPAAGTDHGPLQPLRLRLDSRPPTGTDWHRIQLSARVQVLGSDGRTESFEMPVALLVAVHYQAIA